MKTKLLIFKFTDSPDFDYDDFRYMITHDCYLHTMEDDFSDGVCEISIGVFRVNNSDYTQVYYFINNRLSDYRQNIKNVYVMDGDLSSDAKDLIG
jgi:hypothetical protein